MEKTKNLLKRSLIYLFLALPIINATLQPAALANHTNMNLGLSLYPSNASNLLGTTGYFLSFQMEQEGKWFRPTFGGQLELNSATTTLVFGQMQGGFQIAPAESKFIRPFIGAQAVLGWASYSVPLASYLGIIYGATISAGTEIRFSKKETAMALRILSQYRYTQGTIGGGITGNDLSAVQISIGVIF